MLEWDSHENSRFRVSHQPIQGQTKAPSFRKVLFLSILNDKAHIRQEHIIEFPAPVHVKIGYLSPGRPVVQIQARQLQIDFRHLVPLHPVPGKPAAQSPLDSPPERIKLIKMLLILPQLRRREIKHHRSLISGQPAAKAHALLNIRIHSISPPGEAPPVIRLILMIQSIPKSPQRFSSPWVFFIFSQIIPEPYYR